MAQLKTPKPKTCRSCKLPFVPDRDLQIACSPSCALSLARIKGGKIAALGRKCERKARKDGLERLKTRTKWLAEAKTALQQCRRLTELAKGRGCMSCGRSQSEVMGSPDSWTPGGYWDGGHYLGKGAFPELALEPTNIWLQCKKCNGGSGKYARKGQSVQDSFRANLIEAEGIELVEWLESKHPPAKHTIEDLKIIIADCRAETGRLKADYVP